MSDYTEIRIDADYLRPILSHRENVSHKGDYGHLLIVAGCQNMPGAAVLATGAALKSGCGLVTLHSTERALQAAVNSCPSAILSEDPDICFSRVPDSIGRYSAIAVGPGLGRKPQTLDAFSSLLSFSLKDKVPMVLDADALNLLSSNPTLLDFIPDGSVLTPHMGELERFSSSSFSGGADEIASELSSRTRSVVVLKGYQSRVFTPDRRLLVNTTGNPGMAKGGSGDVLTGLIGGLLARGYRSIDAAALGVWIHGRAGDFMTEVCTAEAYNSSDLIDSLWEGFVYLERGKDQ